MRRESQDVEISDTLKILRKNVALIVLPSFIASAMSNVMLKYVGKDIVLLCIGPAVDCEAKLQKLRQILGLYSLESDSHRSESMKNVLGIISPTKSSYFISGRNSQFDELKEMAKIKGSK